MAKLTTAPVSTFTTAALNTINENFEAIEAAVENTLSRDGTTPNEMTADLDMNDNDILNVNIINATTLILAGETVAPSNLVISNALQAPNNLNDVDDIAQARENLSIPTYVASRTALKALDTTKDTKAFCNGSYWEWTLGDFTARIAADTKEGLFAKADLISAGTGAWVRSIEGPIRAKWFQFNADLSGVSGTNDASSLNALSATVAAAYPDGCVIDFGAMQIYYTDTVTFTTPWEGRFNGARFYGDTAAWDNHGDLSAKIGNISAAADMGDKVITLTSVTGLAVGDHILIHNHAAESLNAQRTYYYDGEASKIQAISGLDVTLEHPIQTNYTGVATDEVYRLDPITVRLFGKVSFEGSEDAATPWVMVIQQAADVRIDGTNFTGGNTRSLYFNQCVGVHASNMYVSHTVTGTGSGYGVSFGNSQDCLLEHSHVHGDNHSVAMGGADTDGAIPCRNIIVRFCHLSNTSDTQSTVDMHGNVINSGYESNTIYGSIGLSGHSIWARFNRVYMKDSSTEWPFTIKEFGGGLCDYSTNEIFLGPNYAGASRVLAFEASSLTQIVNTHFTIRARGNVVWQENDSLDYFAFIFWNGSQYIDDNAGNPEIDWTVDIGDNTIHGTTSGMIQNVLLQTGAASPVFTNPGIGPTFVRANRLITDDALAATVKTVSYSGTFTRTRWAVEWDTSQTLTLANGANSNIAVPNGTLLRITGPTGAFSLTGLVATFDGDERILWNSTSQNFTLTNDATSTAANRFLTTTGADIVTTGVGCVRIRYSGTDSRWLVLSSSL